MLKKLFNRKNTENSLEKAYQKAINEIYEAKKNRTNFIVIKNSANTVALMEMLKTRYTVWQLDCNTLKVIIY